MCSVDMRRPSKVDISENIEGRDEQSETGKITLFERLFVVDPENSSGPHGVYGTIVRPCITECYGLVIFVFMGTMAISSSQGLLVAALAHGFTIFFLVASLGHISGGHFNPAVTVGLALGGGIKPLLALFYVLSQLAGGLIGSACALGALPNSIFDGMKGGANMVTFEKGATFSMGILCEIITTMALVTSVLGAALDTNGKNVLAPLAIGLTVGVDILATGHISGASMNPARSFGPAVLAGAWGDHVVNWVGPLAGALVAAFLYRFVFASPDRNLISVCNKKA